MRRLTRREKRSLLFGGLVMCGILLYRFVADPFVERMRTLDRLIPQKEQELRQMAELMREHEIYKRKVAFLEEKISRAEGNFFLLSFLEETATRSEVRGNLSSIRPQPTQSHDLFRETSVEIKVENVQLPQIVRLLSALGDSPHPIRIKRIHMRTRFSDPQFLDVTLTVAAYEKI